MMGKMPKRFIATLALTLFAPLASAADPVGHTYACSDCPARIPDNGGDADSFAIATATVLPGACAGGPAVGGIDVRAELLHANLGDVRLRLIAPDASSYVLLDRLSDGVGAAGSCSGDDLRATFSSSATEAPACGALIPTINGAFVATISLAALASAPPQAGAWTLEAGDYAGNGDGAVERFVLDVYCTEDRHMFQDGFED
jgi:subtilisin-like proprotein convertase family protein